MIEKPEWGLWMSCHDRRKKKDPVRQCQPWCCLLLLGILWILPVTARESHPSPWEISETVPETPVSRHRPVATAARMAEDWQPDREGPVISGAVDRMLYAGDPVSYRSGVTVTDNRDKAPVLQVDSSQVDLSTPGRYPVTYWATDAAGNRASVTVTLTVMDRGSDFAALEVIYGAVDQVLANIIQENMTDREKIRAIYDWVRNNCSYSSDSRKDHWAQAGYRMLQTRRGDCFCYFGLTKLMLEREGIPNLDVVKVPSYRGDNDHFWSLVSADGGQTWYHFDATPREDPEVDFCLVTDAFLDDYSERHKHSHNRDRSLYPATPEQ